MRVLTFTKTSEKLGCVPGSKLALMLDHLFKFGLPDYMHHKSVNDAGPVDHVFEATCDLSMQSGN